MKQKSEKGWLPIRMSCPWCKCRIILEEGFSEESITELEKRGHVVKAGLKGFKHTLFGKGQVIKRNPADGVLWGGSDPRGDGQALGW